ncbi:MAG: pyridoxamine 5'-phosphate oxidase family protein [Clostridiales Family XIII bacterium]|jgi:nitroimidazol reductase NimA-like FMN-containing flavoprotein (pyridoxamine 5'-phosphate oxidase superfamily)|nr:pyridoxamine 5'-phosphate oxidase family protein [Clostridiales Family XIII bacterium]
MFREMKRSRQSLPKEEISAVLDRCTNGVMACLGDEGYPYAVPLNYVYLDGRIYFHTAKAGHKMDALDRNPKVSFAAVDEDTIVSAEYTSYFRSVIAFGRARVAEGDERRKAFEVLVEKYSGDRPEEEKRKTIDDCERAHIVAIDVEHITGKEAAEYADERPGQVEE